MQSNNQMFKRITKIAKAKYLYTMKTKFLLTILLLLNLITVFAQNPVHFKVQQKQTSPTEVSVIFSGNISKGWHVYSTGLPAGGPTSATFHSEKTEGAKPIGRLMPKGRELNVYDKVFDMKLRYFENKVTFIQKYKITGKTYKIAGYLEYGACNDEMCMPPTTVEFNYKGKGAADAPEAPSETDNNLKDNVDAEGINGNPSQVNTDTAQSAILNLQNPSDSNSVVSNQVQSKSELWQPVIKELQSFTDTQNESHSLWYIFLMGIVGGFVALLTPCVWPIIPMTVSFFLKRAKNDKKKGIRDAITYGISIIVIYMLLAAVITAIFGPQKLNELATNAPFNIAFFLLLLVFAFSFFGWFELRLPASWGNAVDNKAASTTGLISIFLMAFTLSLVSFSCTAPVVGLLLVQAATSGDWVAPTVGMFGFAFALALPFSLFALFPTMLKQAPKSGSWMNMIKVVLGFIELAFALKFFSVADLAYGWRLLDRETFLAIWIVIFAIMGLYLIGKIKFPHDDLEQKAMPVPSIILGMLSLSFALYMVPGLWGAPLKAVSAFAPPVYTQDFNLNHEEVQPKFKDYDLGMAAAAKEGKPVLLDFTGFGCVNCRKMEGAVWTDPEVAKKLNDDYVLISLYVDDKTPLKEPIKVKRADGTERTLRTVGDKWSYLQESKFGYLAQPFYVTVDNHGKPLSGSFVYKEDINGYKQFLDKGIENYKKRK